MERLLFLSVLLVLLVTGCEVSNSISAGYYHTCRLEDGKAKCWGNNEYGQLGLGNTTNQGDDPNEIEALDYIDLGTSENIIQLETGGYHTCALFESGQAKCWGNGYYGELGLGDNANHGDQYGEMGESLPFIDVGTGRTISQLSAGARFTCALLDNMKVKCWGRNYYGHLGIGDRVNRGVAPGQMGDSLPYVHLAADVAQVSAGDGHACALLTTGQVQCFGFNKYGQLGYGDTEHRGDGPNEMGENLPFVQLGEVKPVKITVHYEHSCALFENGLMKCWGDNKYGQIGVGDQANRGDDPNEMGVNLPYVDWGSPVVDFDLGYGYTCALLTTGQIKCVGYNSDGRMGYGPNWIWGNDTSTLGDNLEAVKVGTAIIPVEITTGDSHTCIVTVKDKIKCWGYNAYGELGLGDVESRGTDLQQMGDALPFVPIN
jgi:alpha-tubulin suppressor-like RCC1 family protein